MRNSKKKNFKYLVLTLIIISIAFFITNQNSNKFSASENQTEEELTLDNIKPPQLSNENGWIGNGTPICTSNYNQMDPQIISDGIGGAIITWKDNRSGPTFDIYAQKINSKGHVPWTADGVSIGAEINDQSGPQIASDGVGGAIITWQDYRNGSHYDIYAQRVNLTGDVQWTANGVIICTLGEDQRDPQICSDGTGGAIITWRDYRTGLDYDIYAQRVNLTGDVQWTPNGIAISTEVNSQLGPQIISDGAGGAVVAWNDYRSGSNYDIYAQRVNSTGDVQWTANGTAVCTAGGNQDKHQIINDGAGGAILTWEDDRGGDNIYAQRINSTGYVQWTTDGVAICTAIWEQWDPQITSDGNGGAIITWEDQSKDINPDIYAQKVDPNGNVEWTLDGVVIITDSMPLFDPQITNDGTGGAFIIWHDLRGGNLNIYAQKIDSSGNLQWTTDGLAISTEANFQMWPQITSDGIGGAIITWYDNRILYDEYDIYAQKIDSDGILNWTYNGNAVCEGADNQLRPTICSDGNGGTIITWEDWRTGERDIYTQKIDSNGNVQWTTDGVPICTSGGHQYRPNIVSDGVGGAIITWDDATNIYAQRINSSGDVQWTLNGVAICTEAQSQWFTQIISDGLGGAIITWIDYRSGTNYDIYAQRINSSGIVRWTTNGVAICTAGGNQNNPDIISDGNGGAIITWDDLRSPGLDIYAQRIDSNGNVQWTPNGVAICTRAEHQSNPQICSDGVGGAIIAWQDWNSVTYDDIYVQKISSSGIVQWILDGIAICTKTWSQLQPQITNDGTGGAIITWVDGRNPSDNDIFAQKIDHNGNVRWKANGTAICTELNLQTKPQIESDKIGGAIITWQDERIFFDIYDIYAQKIDSNGNIQWSTNGELICTATDDQQLPQIINNGLGGAIITWQDERNGSSDGNIYARSIQGPRPTSNHPILIDVSAHGSETINWTLYDEYGGGQYRVLANDTVGNFYTWKNWTSWTNDTQINVDINLTVLGAYNYTIEYHNDHYYFGDLDTVIVTIYDDTPPSITINLPNPLNIVFGDTAPNFELEIDELFLNTTWYTLDNGNTNITFSDFFGTLNQTEWDKKTNGTVSITFFANDTSGNVNQMEITVRIDILAPIITIYSPELNEEFKDSVPVYNISIIEGNLNEIWYVLHQEDTYVNVTVTDFTGMIDEVVWRGLSEGNVDITFYASDSFGHIGSSIIYFIKVASGGGDSQGQLWIIGISIAGVAGLMIGVSLIVKPRIKKMTYTKKQIVKAKGELENFELKTRNFVRAKLEGYYGDEWWEKGIPEYIRISMDSKIRTGKIKTLKMKHQFMNYLGYNDYFSVVSEKNNWENIFSDTFPDKHRLGENFESLGEFKSDLTQKNVSPEELGKYPAYIHGIMAFFTEGINIFMSYSTKDSIYFRIKEITDRLESYPKIDRVFCWEEASGEDIVRYMERTLRISRIFILFCSEKSFKSQAVTDEWEAAFQMRKRGLMKIIPVYEHEKDIPLLLMPMLNVKFTKDDFDIFIENLYKEISRGTIPKGPETQKQPEAPK